jgi:oxaloacetate decarboxylase alpha subunit
LAESTNDVAKAYSVSVKGQVFEVEVAQNGELTNVQAAHLATGQVLNSPLAGNIFKVLFRDGDVVIIVEAMKMKMKMKMKMEMEIRASISGLVSNISTKQGDAVQTGQPLLVIG